MSNRTRLAALALMLAPAVLFAQEKQGTAKKSAASAAAATDTTKHATKGARKHVGKKGAKSAKADSTKK